MVVVEVLMVDTPTMSWCSNDNVELAGVEVVAVEVVVVRVGNAGGNGDWVYDNDVSDGGRDNGGDDVDGKDDGNGNNGNDNGDGGGGGKKHEFLVVKNNEIKNFLVSLLEIMKINSKK